MPLDSNGKTTMLRHPFAAQQPQPPIFSSLHVGYFWLSELHEKKNPIHAIDGMVFRPTFGFS